MVGAAGRFVLRDAPALLLGIGFSYLLFKILLRSNEPQLPVQHASEAPVFKTKVPEPVSRQERKLLFVGVLSAGRFLNTRIAACNNTWGQNVESGSIEYFVGTRPEEEFSGVNIVTLPGASDHEYPPQGKAFRMLKYMCENHLDKFSWFLRADDDAYFKIEKLEAWLRSGDPNEKYYIGQAGYGRAPDLGRLHLDGGNFCMGGPGVIFSRATMKGLCPHLDKCMNDDLTRKTGEEDVELGRCVYKHLGVRCTSAYEFMRLFYHSYPQEYTGHPYLNLHHNDNKNVFDIALSLHHVKIPHVMFSVHDFFLSKLRVSWQEEANNLLRGIQALKDVDSSKIQELLSSMPEPSIASVKEVFVPAATSNMGAPHTDDKEVGPAAADLESSDWVYIDSGAMHDLSSSHTPNSVGGRAFVFLSDIAEKAVITRKLVYLKTLRVMTHFNPGSGIRYLVEVAARNSSAAKGTGDLSLQLSLSQGFDEPEQVVPTAVSVPDQTELIVIIPLAQIHHPFFQRFMQMYTTKFLTRDGNSEQHVGFLARLYVISFSDVGELSDFQANGVPLDPSLVVSLYQSKFTDAAMRVISTPGPYSLVKALQLGLKWATSELDAMKLENAVVFLSSVEVDVTGGFVLACQGQVRKTATAFFPIVASSSRIAATSPHVDSSEEKARDTTSWLSSSYAHLCASHNYLASVLKDLNSTQSSLDLYNHISSRTSTHQSEAVFRAFQSDLTIRWDELHSQCSSLIKATSVPRASDIFPSCSSSSERHP